MKQSLPELANNLGLTPDTLERWIRQGRIPILKKGDAGEFSKPALIKWAHEHHLDFVEKELGAVPKPAENPDSLASALSIGGVAHNTLGNDVESVLAQAVRHIPLMTDESRQALLHALLERERMSSTGIGKGIAIPHPRTPLPHLADRSFITTCFLQQEIDYHAVDDKPVFALFILYGPTIKTHLHLLSGLAFHVRDPEFIAFLRSQPSSEVFYEYMAELEQRLNRFAG